MASPGIRLVYSDTSPEKAADARTEWGLANARQLSLFDEFNVIRTLTVPVTEISSYYFLKILEIISPRLAIDTREFPDFFSIFPSTSDALQDFHRRGISYTRIPILSPVHEGDAWSQIENLKSIFTDYLELKTNSPILILTSNTKNLKKVSDKLRGYISQEITYAKYEEISI